MTPARAYRPPRAGQTLALAAPAGAVEPAALEEARRLLAELVPQMTLRLDPPVLARADYLAGPDSERADHLARLMTDPAVGAVMAARGGFGCSRLLPRLDLEALAASRRLLIGFSDLTCLLLALTGRGLVTVHGPVATQLPRLERESRAELARLLRGEPLWPRELAGRPLSPGRAAGPLLGGNLTSLCHLLGTPWLPNLRGAILFLEETNEPAYRLDRLLTQLELAGVWEQVAGVAVGWLSQGEPDPPELAEVLRRRLAGLGRPVVTSLPFGHGPRNRLLPLGARAELDGAAGVLRVGVDLA